MIPGNIETLKQLQAEGNPIVVNYGMGVDSTAVIVSLQRHGLTPDLIIFADTGGEKPETYAYLATINAYLAEIGFPAVTVARFVPTRAKYTTLEGKCLANEGLPSLATGGHSCAMVFKVEVMDKFISSWAPAVAAWKTGKHVIRLIGYDAGARDTKRLKKHETNAAKPCMMPVDDGTAEAAKLAKKAKAKQAKRDRETRKYRYAYPLQMLQLDREACKALIKSVALSVPVKSACFFCPASTKKEVVWLRDTHPDLYARAVAMETGAATGKHTLKRQAEGKRLTCKGLGRQFAWSSLATAKAEDMDDNEKAYRP